MCAWRSCDAKNVTHVAHLNLISTLQSTNTVYTTVHIVHILYKNAYCKKIYLSIHISISLMSWSRKLEAESAPPPASTVQTLSASRRPDRTRPPVPPRHLQ